MNNKINKKKAKCPCCGATGYSFSEPYLGDEYKHIFGDHGWIPEEAEGNNLGFMGKTWVSSCTHKTGKKVEYTRNWNEFECECTCEYD